MGRAKGLMENCLSLFATVRDCSPGLALFELFASVLSLSNEQSNNSPLRIPLENTQARRARLSSYSNRPILAQLQEAFRDLEDAVER